MKTISHVFWLGLGMSLLADLTQTQTVSLVMKQSAPKDFADKVGTKTDCNIDMQQRCTWWITQGLRGEVTQPSLLTHIGSAVHLPFQVAGQC